MFRSHYAAGAVLSVLLSLSVISSGLADGDEAPPVCTINKVTVPDISEEEKVGAAGCEATYYGLCERLVVQAQDRCDRICQTFGQRNSLEALAFRECDADEIGTSIAAFDEALHCRIEGEENFTSCALASSCKCLP